MKLEPARRFEPLAVAHREFVVEVYGPLFGAIGRLALWQALNKMAVNVISDLRVPKERHYVQVHTHRFTVGAPLPQFFFGAGGQQ